MQNCIQSNFKSSHDLLKVFTRFKGPKFKVSDLWQSLTITLGNVKMQTTCNIQWHRLYITIWNGSIVRKFWTKARLKTSRAEFIFCISVSDVRVVCRAAAHFFLLGWLHMWSEALLGMYPTTLASSASEVSKAVQASSSQLHQCLLWTSMQGYLWHTPGLRLSLLVSEGDPQPLSCILDSRTIEPYS